MNTAYRYYDQMYCGVSISVSGSESYYPIGPKIELREYTVVKTTPKGFWIATGFSFDGFRDNVTTKRWIGNDSRKKFACLTKEEAMESFRARKRRQISVLKRQLEIAEKALRGSFEPVVNGAVTDCALSIPDTSIL